MPTTLMKALKCKTLGYAVVVNTDSNVRIYSMQQMPNNVVTNMSTCTTMMMPRL